MQIIVFKTVIVWLFTYNKKTKKTVTNALSHLIQSFLLKFFYSFGSSSFIVYNGL